MGLDITIKINNEPEYDFSGRSVFGQLRDYMIKKYNYEYGTDMKINKTIIKDMIDFLMNQCFTSDDTYMADWRMTHVKALIQCYVTLNEEPNSIITWECDW